MVVYADGKRDSGIVPVIFFVFVDGILMSVKSLILAESRGGIAARYIR